MKKIIYLIILIGFINCKDSKEETHYLGIVNIDITGHSDAMPYFEKGLLLLHSFEYEDAGEAFIEAQRIDPEMAMAYWGEAMTYNHSLWSEQDYEKGRKALNELSKFNYKSKTTQLEQDFIEAVNILYKQSTDKKERDKLYSEFMNSLNNKYPDNHEVASFYALSLLGASEDGRDDDLYGKGAKIAQGIIAENPKHPGALHYLIHSYDDPGHAHLALDAADAYAKVAPDASHALHMPSHIYVAKGMWDEVISSNINSYQASLNRMKRKNLNGDARGYHAFHWLEYGYLQQGNEEKAREMVLDMEKFMNNKPSKRARAHMVFLKGTYLVETDNWDNEIKDIKVETNDLNITIRSQYHFLEGMNAYKDGNQSQLDSIIGVMEVDLNRESYVVNNSGVKLCAAVTRDEASRSDLIGSEVRQLQLRGLLASLKGEITEAENLFIKSIELNSTVNYSYGPPSIQKPVHELFADWLMDQNRIDDAAKHYKQGLESAPKRTRALKGLEKAGVL